MKLIIDPPLITLIMPVFNSMSDFERGNGKFLLANAIESIIDQTFGNFELIILDNLSDDTTFEFCQGLSVKDKRIRVLEDTQRRSPEEAIYKLIQMASGQFTAIVNDDDKWDRNFLGTLLLVHSSGDYDLVFSNGQYLDTDDRLVGRLINDKNLTYTLKSSYSDNFCRYIHNRNPYPISFGLFRTKSLRHNYPQFKFHKYKANMDNLFISQFLLSTNKIIFVDQDLFFYRSKTRSYQHAAEFHHSSVVSQEVQLYELLDHQNQFTKSLSVTIHKTNVSSYDKQILETANVNSFLNYTLKMFYWQLEKPGLNLKEFRTVTRIIKLLDIILLKILVKSDKDLAHEFDVSNQARIAQLTTHANLVSRDILYVLDLCATGRSISLLEDLELCLNRILSNFNIGQNKLSLGGFLVSKLPTENFLYSLIKQILFKSFVYYKYIKSR